MSDAREIGDPISKATAALKRLRLANPKATDAINEAFKLGREVGRHGYHVELRGEQHGANDE